MKNRSEYITTLCLTLAPLDAPKETMWQHTPLTADQARACRIDDLKAANRSNNRFLKQAAFRALNNLNKLVRV